VIQLTDLRELTLAERPGPGRHSYLSAASGLVKSGAFFYVVADDEYHLGEFPIDGDGPGRLIRVFAGTLPLEPAQRKQQKPDLEALVHLPAFSRYPAGALLCVPSGSKPNRHVGALLALGENGAVIPEPRTIDLSPLYARLARAISALNIEGAAVLGDALWLMQRGNHRESRNACIRFDLRDVLRSLSGDGPFDVVAAEIETVDLGDIDGVPLCFSDVAPLPNVGFIFTAIAEDTTDSYRDGPCVGAEIGVIDIDCRLRYLERLADAPKVEGIHAEVAGQLVRLWLVTDADNADTPGRLLTAEICVE